MKLQIIKSIRILILMVGLILLNSCEEKDPNFEIYEYPELNVTDFSPLSAHANEQVTINGSNFGTLKQAATVYFNNVAIPQANILSIADNKIVVTVPVGTQTGKVAVKVWLYTKQVGTNDFTYLP